MLGLLAGFFLDRGASPKNAKGYAWGITLFGALILLGIMALTVKSCIISNHDNAIEASAAKADRQADENEINQRVADDARRAQEQDQLTEAIKNAPKDPAIDDDRERALAFHRCLSLQQRARSNGLKPPTCV